MNDYRFLKLLIFANSIVPLGLLAWDSYQHRLGVNPIEFVLQTTGLLALLFVTLTLSISPIMKLTGWHPLMRVRRMLGLFAFSYATLHFITYSWFDKSFKFFKIISDVFDRQFIAFG